MSKGSSSTETTSQSKTDPWGPSIPYLVNFLQDSSGTRANLGPSSDQLDAFATLKNNAAQGNPWTSQIGKLAEDQFNAKSNAGVVGDSFAAMQKNLGDYASGKMLDFDSNPYIQKMLKTVGDDTQNRINQMFAGAGRDLSGSNQMAVSRGVQQAQLPILTQLYQQEQQNQINANQILNNAATSGAQVAQNLDQSALATRQGGVATGKEALNASNYAPNTILNLDEQLKKMPINDLALYASLLLPAAGLGGSSVGHGTSNTESSGFNLGTVAGAVGAFL